MCTRQQEEIRWLKARANEQAREAQTDVGVARAGEYVGSIRQSSPAVSLLNSMKGEQSLENDRNSFQYGGNSRAPTKERTSIQFLPSTSHHGSRTPLVGRSSFSDWSERSETESMEGCMLGPGGGVEGGDMRDTQMTQYLKYLALPEVQPFSGCDKNYTFPSFLEAFELKYPRHNWADAELCALFRSKLGSERQDISTNPSHRGRDKAGTWYSLRL
ncbi:hypothetical protein Aduo_001263 [Ancylostoma duodenale]